MKVKIKEIHKDFPLIELTLTIESENELIGVWHRFNMGLCVLKKSNIYMIDDEYPGLVKAIKGNSGSYEVWDRINDIVTERNIEV